MNAAFLTNSKEQINRVYSADTQEKLKKMFSFYPSICTVHESDKLADAECIFSTWGMPQYTEEEIAKFFPNLKIVFYGAGSVQAFARPFFNSGIKVVSAWMANSVPVAEYTLAQILLANKGFFQVAKQCNSKKERDRAKVTFKSFSGNYNTNVGLIGLGAIGSGVAELLKSFKLNILAYDPFASTKKAEHLGVTLVSLETLFETCQTISNHCANLPETQGILNENLLSRMKDNATFINTGRGAQVIEADLIKVLKDKPNRTAVLDVTWPEPPEAESELYTLPNVILTPHIAGSAGDECIRMGDYMLFEAENFLCGKPLKYLVSTEMLKTMA